MSDFQVFVSYNVASQQLSADALAGPLRTEGYKVFVCASSIPQGADWRTSINISIKTSVVVFVLLNDAYSNSPECITELNFALSLRNSQIKNKDSKILNIVPVVFKGFNPSSYPNIENILANVNGTSHDGTLLTNGNSATLTNLLKVARGFLNPSVGNDVKPGLSSPFSARATGASDSKALSDLSVDEVCALFSSLKMEAHIPAVKKHNMDGLVLEVLNSTEDLMGVDIVLPNLIGAAFVKRVNGFKSSGVPLNLIGGLAVKSATAPVSVASASPVVSSPVVKSPVYATVTASANQVTKGKKLFYYGKYEGDLVAGNAHGQGVMEYNSGSRYAGEFKDDKVYGQGVYTWPDGRRYEGEWKDANMNGRGVYTWPNGQRYEGEWKDGKLDGQGVYTWPDCQRYEGEFKDDKKHGRGVHTWPDGQRYEGEFKDDKKHGRGVHTLPSGQRYEGEWEDGKKNGRGLRTFADGTKQDGKWKNDQFIG